MDCSGAVDAVDALKILRSVAGLSVAQNEPCDDIGSAAPEKHGDINCNGDVDAVDALFILRYVAALSVNMPQGCPIIGA